MRSTSAPRSPAFLLRRSGAHVRMPPNFPRRISASSSLYTGRSPVDFAEWLSRRISTTSSPSLSASWSISLTWESMDSTCRSSDSVLFLAYRQYFTFLGICSICVRSGAPSGLVMDLVIIRPTDDARAVGRPGCLNSPKSVRINRYFGSLPSLSGVVTYVRLIYEIRIVIGKAAGTPHAQAGV